MNSSPSPTWIKKLLLACELLDSDASLPAIAQQLGASPFHFQRQFTRWVGMSPKRYQVARRDQRVRRLLSEGVSITQSFLQAGYESPSRFYQDVSGKLGMPPLKYASKGAGLHLRVSMGTCQLGEFLIGLSKQGVCEISLGDDAQVLLDEFQARFSRATITPASCEDDACVARVVGLLDGSSAAVFPLDIRGTVFQRKVWQALTQIPMGKTASYSDVANLIGCPGSSRAVAAACAANTLAVAIPCHRIIKSDGALSGYRWGVDRKRKLLNRESPFET